MALEAYRQELLSRRQVGLLLGMNFWETEQFMKDHQAYLHYDIHDFKEDRLTHERLFCDKGPP